ncbi:MAG: TetR/AcrR family transcriptional regulator [Myxococcota bacterium]
MQKRGAAKRNEILDAAATGFCEEGFEAITMDRIAERAGASKRTVYNHFGSKEALFHAVFMRHLEGVMAQTDAMVYRDDLPLEEQLRAFGMFKAEMATNPTWLGLYRMAFGVMMHDPALGQKVSVQAAADEGALVLWIRAAHQAGRLHVPDAGRAASQFWSLIKAELFWPQVIGLAELPSEQAKNVVVDGAIEMFLACYRSHLPEH